MSEEENVSAEDLLHYGIIRRSGRYPWGSGKDPYQRSIDFFSAVNKLKADGLTEAEIAEGFGMTTTELRATVSIAKNERHAAEVAQTVRLKEKGLSNVAIGKIMGKNESSVRNLLAASERHDEDVLTATANVLRNEVAAKKYLDVGKGTENHLGISRDKLKTAIAILKEEGYDVHYVKIPQLGVPGQYTSQKVLVPPDTPYKETYAAAKENLVEIIGAHSDDGGLSFQKTREPVSISSSRVEVRYAEQGGADKDGVIEIRRGVPDISLGDARYAQVRIAVDGTHYLKGMAMYADDLPKGVDMRFNTNKSDAGDPKLAMKPIKDDPENPFGATVRQRYYEDADGKRKQSVMNIVNEEGEWSTWSRNLSSQMLSKQPKDLAKQQLDLVYKQKLQELEEIKALTNPTVKKELLRAFADGADSSAVHLKAAALPRQATKVILPLSTIKDTEIYAPGFRNGERVALVRYPHGGKFEIPELTVNNRLPEGSRLIPNALDAVGISSKTAARLSGADFDGDTVIVIPNKDGKTVKSSAPLKQLEGFDPQKAYPGYEGMKVMSARTKQTEMGNVSNLITDMTIKGADDSELARAVRHSMVVIDAEKHKLNYKQSAKDNGINELKAKYQGSARSGASTLISRASSQAAVPMRKPRPAAEGGPVDPKTGEKRFVYTGETYVNKQGKVVQKTIRSTKMAETNDAYTLLSRNPAPVEVVYADHANKLKALANEARKEDLTTKTIPYDPSAKKVYAKEVASLNEKLDRAQRNAPLERKAQALANSIVGAKLQANPGMDKDDLKKEKGRALTQARIRIGASKAVIKIEDREWEAIQSGAITNNKLTQILKNADLDEVKQRAMPRNAPAMTSAKIARAKAMLAGGYTLAEVADALGVSTSTLTRGIQ